MGFFDKIVTDFDNIEQEFLGPDYSYHKNIRNPSQLGMSGDGSISALSDDIAGIIDYVEVLVSGTGPASKTGKPLGDKFFLKTGGQCKDYKTGKNVTRSMYINNVPTSNIPIISNLSGMSFPDFRGIVPGMLEDIYAINPLKMFRAFMEGNDPICAEVVLDTIDANNNRRRQSAYIPIAELKDLQGDGKIPKGTVTNEMLNALNKSVDKETFINLCDVINGCKERQETIESIYIKPPSNKLSSLYYLFVAFLLFYISYRMMKK